MEEKIDLQDIPMDNKLSSACFPEIKQLSKGHPINEQLLLEICEFANRRLDCADFRMITILRTHISYSQYLSESTQETLISTILNYKYWMDEAGEDSVCYWSENHQLIFFTCGYIAGKYFADDVFISGKRGSEMKEISERRLIEWMEYRFKYGITEWHSNTYYEEDIAPLTLLIDFAGEELKTKANIIMDLFALDIAVHSYKGLFSVTSGRCYEEQKRIPLTQNTLEIQEYLFGKKYIGDFDYSKITANLLLSTYEVPEVLVNIANDTSTQVIKTSMGHDINEIKSLRSEFSDEAIDYLQWAMEAFSNPEIISNTLRMYNKYNMDTNIFLNDFDMLNKPYLKPFLKPISKILNPYTNGVAIQRVNSYTYKTDQFILSNAQRYHPQTFGDQQHIWQLTINEKFSIFTTHPGVSAFDDNARNFSPSYWVGNGILPDSVQYENKLICVYDLRVRKGFMESERVNFTHLNFPREEFDEVVIKGKYLFGKLGDVSVAIICKNEFKYDGIEAIQEGKVTGWICEVAVENFEEFINRIEATPVKFEVNNVEYDNIKHVFNKKFSVDGNDVDLTYNLHESAYANYKRTAEEINVEFSGNKLELNFNKAVRKV